MVKRMRIKTMTGADPPGDVPIKSDIDEKLQSLKNSLATLREDQNCLQSALSTMRTKTDCVIQELNDYEKLLVAEKVERVPVPEVPEMGLLIDAEPESDFETFALIEPEGDIIAEHIATPQEPIKEPIKKKKRHTEENFVNVVISRIGVFFVTVAFLVLYSSVYLAFESPVFRVGSLVILGLVGIFIGRLFDRKNSHVLADAMISIGLALSLIAVVVATDSLIPYRVSLGVALVPILIVFYSYVLGLAFYLLRQYDRFSTYVLSTISICTVTLYFVVVFTIDDLSYLAYTIAYMSLLYNILVVSKFAQVQKGLLTFMVPSLIYALLPQLSRLGAFNSVTVVLNLIGVSLLLYQGYLLAQDEQDLRKLSVFGFIWIGFSFLFYDLFVGTMLSGWGEYPLGLTTFFYTTLQTAVWFLGLSMIAKKKLAIIDLYRAPRFLKVFAVILTDLSIITLINVFDLYLFDAGTGYLLLSIIAGGVLLGTTKKISPLFTKPVAFIVLVLLLASPFVIALATYWFLFVLGVGILMSVVLAILYRSEFKSIQQLLLGQFDLIDAEIKYQRRLYESQIINYFFDMMLIAMMLFVLMASTFKVSSASFALIAVGLVYVLMSHAYKLYLGKKEIPFGCVGLKSVLWNIVTYANYFLYGVSTILLVSEDLNSPLTYTLFFIYMSVTILSEFHLFYKRLGEKWSIDRQAVFALVRALGSIVLVMVSQDVATIWLTVALGSSLVVALFAGFRFDLKELRLCGLGLVFILAAKLLLLDSWNLTTILKVASYGLFGVTLIVIAYVYNKYFTKMRK